MVGLNSLAVQHRARMLLGGAVSLKSYLSVVNPELLNKVVGHTVEVMVGESEAGNYGLYLALPLSDGTFYKLNVDWTDLDEGDKINISSIVVLFVDNPDGKTTLRCTGICPDGDVSRVSQEAIRDKILQSYKCLMDEFEKREKVHSKAQTEIPEDFKKAVEKSVYRKRNDVGNRFWQYELECEWNRRKEYSEEENWYAMTDGMYGDYLNEGYDGNYEFMGY